jgi:hypothetical protein
MSQYCTPSDVTTYALPATALATVSSGEQTAACVAASEEADSFLRGRFQLPLASWGQDVVRYTAYIAAYLMMSKRGFQPLGGADAMIRENYYRAVGYPDRPGTGWFPQIQRQSIHPDVVEGGVSAPKYQLPQVYSAPKRGW